MVKFESLGGVQKQSGIGLLVLENKENFNLENDTRHRFRSSVINIM